jgi:protein-S-isoprenylcysteine O-methyltransferase Ste14
LSETRAALLKTVAFMVVPLVLLVAVPALILHLTGGLHPPRLSAGAIGGIALIAAGVAIDLWSNWGFIHTGHGSPAPIAPPKVLVIDGPFRYVRNPMYLGGGAILAGEALVFAAWILVAYMAVVLVFFHLLTVLYEEPVLLRTFGEAYREYREVVPRWIPKLNALKKLG